MSYNIYRWCVVSNCKNTSIKTPEKLFIKVPNNIIMRNIWLRLAGRNPEVLSTKSLLFFCEDHFDTMLSIRGRKLMIVDNYTFRRDKETSLGVTYRCTKCTCPASIYVDKSEQVLLHTSNQHNHPRSEKLHVKKLQNAIKRKAIEDISERPCKIINTSIEQESAKMKITNKDIENIRKSIYRSRRALPRSLQGIHNALEFYNYKTNTDVSSNKQTYLIKEEIDEEAFEIPSLTNLNEELSHELETKDIKIEEHEIDHSCIKRENEECISSTSNPLEFKNFNLEANYQDDSINELDRPGYIKIEEQEHNDYIASPQQYKTDIKVEDEEVTLSRSTSPKLQNLNFVDVNYCGDVKLELDRPEEINIIKPEYLFVSDVSAATSTNTVDDYNNESNNKSVQVNIITMKEFNEHLAFIKSLQIKNMRLNKQLENKNKILKEMQEKLDQCQCKAKRTDMKNKMKK